MSKVLAIEIGFGSCSVCGGVKDGKPVVVTFPSIVAQVDNRADMSAGLSKRDTVTVSVDGSNYEVGPEAHLATGKTTTRILNSQYIDSPQYKALFLGSLAMAKMQVVDLLVLGVPVTSLHRVEELKKMSVGIHQIGDKKVEVKSTWVIVQPLGGLLSYADQIGQAGYAELREINTLSVDCGYGTLDFLVSRGLKINESRSSAVDAGMGVLINELWERSLKSAFPRADKLPTEVIDQAFWKTPGVLRISGKKYPFPLCIGKDVDGNDVAVTFDAQTAIDSFTHAAMTSLKNIAGTGTDIDQIILFGGPAHIYLPALQAAYPDHTIRVLSNNLTAVCEGMYLGGLQYAKQLAAKTAA